MQTMTKPEVSFEEGSHESIISYQVFLLFVYLVADKHLKLVRVLGFFDASWSESETYYRVAYWPSFQVGLKRIISRDDTN